MMPRRKAAQERMLIGWREYVDLPDLDVRDIKAKVDTGARTSAIHAWYIKDFEVDGAPWVSFELHPLQRDNTVRVRCSAPVLARRRIRNSGGAVEFRPIIRTRLKIGGLTFPIELSLTKRDEMGFRMLLGRAALRRRLLIDPGKSFLLGKVKPPKPKPMVQTG